MPVLIDDVEVAADGLRDSALAALGRELRKVLVALVGGRPGWRVLDYGGFVSWAAELGASVRPYVLDKLLPEAATPRGRWSVEAHRVLTGSAAGRRNPEYALQLGAAVPGAATLLIDDAAYTGATLARAATALGVDRALVCVATPRAREHLRAAGVALTAQHHAPAGQDILHLRDLVPWLPWSGRRVAGRAALAADGGNVDVRVAPLLHAGGALFQLASDDPLLDAVHAATERALNLLGPDFTVGDLPRLGVGLAAPLTNPDDDVTIATPLRTLLRRP